MTHHHLLGILENNIKPIFNGLSFIMTDPAMQLLLFRVLTATTSAVVLPCQPVR